MASDLSSFLKDELANTLEQLLSKSTTVDSVSALDVNSLDDSQCIEVSVKFEFSTISSTWKFYIPSLTATKFEYFMLGGMGDLKEHIDDEIADAVNEIISNVCGSLCTSVNAQGFPDVSSIKSEVLDFSIKSCSDIEDNDRTYTLDLALDGEKLPIYLSLDEIILPYLSSITGYNDSANHEVVSSPQNTVSSPSVTAPQPAMSPSVSAISSLLSEDSAENLQLLFNIKLKLSVRLGTKNFLLKDILRWDIGEIIELEQMVNEPLDILVNGVKIGEGEAVIVEGKFGLKIKNIGDGSTKLSQIGI
ncbi:MAG: FliM/FliN family flagellar motor switch protein [Campylobacteraceae bacterium]|nr:FliM/FliN family flagellar motor switch protein [Campylobacteraceae bacterium]